MGRSRFAWRGHSGAHPAAQSSGSGAADGRRSRARPAHRRSSGGAATRARVNTASGNHMSDGRFYEDFSVGLVMRHSIGRTVTPTDNSWFSMLTCNTNPIHFDRHYAAQTEFGQPLVNSTFTLAVVLGITVADVSQNAVNLGWDEVRMPAPVFEGDTLYAQSEVLSVRESESRPAMGVVGIKTTGFKQDGTVIMEFRRTILVYKRGKGPKKPEVLVSSRP